MRLVIERLISSDAPPEELRAAADRLDQYAEHLATHPRRQRYEGFSESALAEGGGHYDVSPLIGRSNPLAPTAIQRVPGSVPRARGSVALTAVTIAPGQCGLGMGGELTELTELPGY